MQPTLSLQELPGHKRHPRIFLDKLCLVPGESWNDGFLYGLQRSAMAILLISQDGLKKIQRAASEPGDNLLLEYEFALQARSEGKMKVLPIFVDNADGTKFNSFASSEYPDEKHMHSKSTTSKTVRATMKDLFSLQGIHMSRDASFRDKITEIMNLMGACVASPSGERSLPGPTIAATPREEPRLEPLSERSGGSASMIKSNYSVRWTGAVADICLRQTYRTPPFAGDVQNPLVKFVSELICVCVRALTQKDKNTHTNTRTRRSFYCRISK